MTTVQQSREALVWANEQRSAQAEIKRMIHAGEMSIAEAMREPAMGRVPVFGLLLSIKGIGVAHAKYILRTALLQRDRQIGMLSEREQATLVRVYEIFQDRRNRAVKRREGRARRKAQREAPPSASKGMVPS